MDNMDGFALTLIACLFGVARALLYQSIGLGALWRRHEQRLHIGIPQFVVRASMRGFVVIHEFCCANIILSAGHI